MAPDIVVAAVAGSNSRHALQSTGQRGLIVLPKKPLSHSVLANCAHSGGSRCPLHVTMRWNELSVLLRVKELVVLAALVSELVPVAESDEDVLLDETVVGVAVVAVVAIVAVVAVVVDAVAVVVVVVELLLVVELLVTVVFVIVVSVAVKVELVMVDLVVSVLVLVVADTVEAEVDVAVRVLDVIVLIVRLLVVAVVVLVVEGDAATPSIQPFSSEPSPQSISPSHW